MKVEKTQNYTTFNYYITNFNKVFLIEKIIHSLLLHPTGDQEDKGHFYTST